MCVRGTVDRIRELKEQAGGDGQLLATNDNGASCFHIAAGHGRLELLQELNAWNVFDIHAPINSDTTPYTAHPFMASSTSSVC